MWYNEIPNCARPLLAYQRQDDLDSQGLSMQTPSTLKKTERPSRDRPYKSQWLDLGAQV